jgi:hypothetical protein
MASRAPWAAHFGLARTPFGKAIAAKDLFVRQAHAQATARNTGGPAARCLPCGRSFSADPRSEPRGHVSVHVAL